MPAPIISPITSIHSVALGSLWSYQPTVTPVSDAATSWAATGLPPGLTIHTTTGLISGMTQDEGVFLVRLVATNASGNSIPLVFPMGVRATGQEFGAALRLDIDMQTGAVFLPDRTAQLWLKSGDIMPVAIGFVDGDGLLDIPQLVLVRFYVKETDDQLAIALNDGLVQEVGTGIHTRYITFLDLTAPELRRLLDDWEDEKGTSFTALAEIEWTWLNVRPGFSGQVEAVRTSATFELVLYRELSPPTSS